MDSMLTKNPTKSKLIQDVRFDEYFQATTWEEYNRQFFDQLAPKYDLTKKVISCGFHDRFMQEVVDRIPLSPHTKVLDLCTGTGDIAISLAKKNPSIHIYAIDASQKMLELARAKSKKADVEQHIKFEKGDVLNLPYEDETFSTVIISFGLRNLTTIPEAIKEFYRVTTADGVFVNVDFTKPRDIRKFIYNIYLKRLVPFVGKHFFHRKEFNSFQYLSASNEYFPLPSELVKIYEASGFSNAKIYEYMLGGVSQQIVWKPKK